MSAKFARPHLAAHLADVDAEEREEILGLYDVPNYAVAAGTVRLLNNALDAPAAALPWHDGTIFNTRIDNDLSLAMFVGGTYEPNEFAFLDGLVRPGMKAVDGGGPTGRVLAVEPSSRDLARIRASLAANKIGNTTVVAAALAERPGETSLKVAQAEHAGHKLMGEFIL